MFVLGRERRRVPKVIETRFESCWSKGNDGPDVVEVQFARRDQLECGKEGCRVPSPELGRHASARL